MSFFIKIFSKTVFSLILISLLLFLSSCYKKTENIHNPFYLKAQNLYSEGKYKDAIFFFNKYLKLYPDSSRAHYNLASIYIEKEDYVMAIFHFKKYLELEPNSPDKPIIKKWISASEASLYKELGREFKTADSEREVQQLKNNNPKLESEIKSLKKQNDQMRNFILKHKDKLLPQQQPPETLTSLKSDNKIIKAENIAGNNNSSLNTDDTSIPREYTVQPGDSLYKISKKMYGTYKYYRMIWNANKETLDTPSSLKVGDKIILPPIKKQ